VQEHIVCTSFLLSQLQNYNGNSEIEQPKNASFSGSSLAVKKSPRGFQTREQKEMEDRRTREKIRNAQQEGKTKKGFCSPCSHVVAHHTTDKP
jgi:hypothetical protein